MKSGTARQYRMGARAEATAATGERIIAAATELFLTRQYEEVALGDVARLAGVTVQTLIRRFGSKEGLVAAAAEVGSGKVREQRNEAPIGDVAGAVRNLFEHYEQWGDRVLLMLSQEGRVEPLRRITDAGRALHREWVERTFSPWLRDRGKRSQQRLAQLVAVTDVYVWKLFRRDQGLSREAAERALRDLVDLITGES
jgi:AcrR family transcriptional regulator